MGCTESKITVTPSPIEPRAPQDGRNNNHTIGCKFTKRNDRRVSDPAVPGGTHPTPTEADDHTTSPSIDPYQAGRKVDSFLMKYPANSLKKFRSENQSSMALQMLQERQRIANAKREAVMKRKRDFAQKVFRRGDNILTQIDSKQKTTTLQIETRVRMSDILRAAKHKEILDRQRLSEQRTRHVRERQLEPLKYPSLTADMLLAKQRAAEEKRFEVLKKRSEISHRYSKRKQESESVRRNLDFHDEDKQYETSESSFELEHGFRRCTCGSKHRRLRTPLSDME